MNLYVDQSVLYYESLCMCCSSNSSRLGYFYSLSVFQATVAPVMYINRADSSSSIYLGHRSLRALSRSKLGTGSLRPVGAATTKTMQKPDRIGLGYASVPSCSSDSVFNSQRSVALLVILLDELLCIYSCSCSTIVTHCDSFPIDT